MWAAAMGGDGSTVLVGDTEGASWSHKHTGSSDFVAVKFDSSGNVLWTWQVTKIFCLPSIFLLFATSSLRVHRRVRYPLDSVDAVPEHRG